MIKLSEPIKLSWVLYGFIAAIFVGGMSYQRLVSADESATASIESVSEDIEAVVKRVDSQDARIEQLITLANQQAIQQARTSQATEANTRAIHNNTQTIKEVADKQDRTLQRILERLPR